MIDAVVLRRTWTRRSADVRKDYSDWHLVESCTIPIETAPLKTLCGGEIPPERTERPGDARAFKRVCPPCIEALTASQQPKRGW